jgi:hypothetical protein
LADILDYLDIEIDTITQQKIFLTPWMNKFDELAGILGMLALMGR